MNGFQKILLFIVVLMIVVPGISDSQSIEKSNKRFFGLHFDFHATRDDKNIGKGIDESSIDLLLNLIRPDFVQVDTKGVHGISSYPTEIGFVAGPYEKDILRIWRDISNKYGVDLYSHYTTIMDEEAVSKYPSWARIKNDGKNDKAKVSIFSDYKDSLFIPQVKEMIDKYGINGIWIDADSWALEPEYGNAVLKELKQKTSLNKIPSSDNEDKGRYLEFLRKAYVSYANDYIEKIHSYDPDFKIGINWVYSKMMPESPDIDVDYLTADMSGKNWIYDAAYDARIFASYNKPWDLMSWSFSDKGIKPERLLMIEASEVLSMGGGYQSYWFQTRNGGYDNNNLGLMKRLSDFCRQREQFCFETEIIPQVGVFFSRETWASHTSTVYNGGGNDNIQGITSLLLDAGASVSIIMEYQIDDLGSFPLIVLPETDVLSLSSKTALLNYVRDGGKLLIIGKDAASNFTNELGVDIIEPFVFRKFILKDNSSKEQFDLPYLQVKADNGTDVLFNTYTSGNSEKKYSPLLTSRKMGLGVIAGLYTDLGDYYYKNDSKMLRMVTKDIVSKLFKDPVIEIDTDKKIHSVATRKNGELLIQLVNMYELKPWEQASYYSSINPLNGVKVRIKSSSIPTKVIQQPENKELNFDYKDGFIDVTIPLIDVYSILQIVN